MASSTDASTPTASSMSQLRAICAPTATRTSAMTAFRPRRLRRTARPLQNPVAPAARRLPQAGEHQHRERQQHERQPPRQPERANERERRQRRQGRLDREDRHLGRDQRRHARGLVGSGAAQGGDPGCRADLVVELAAEVAQARRPEQPAPADGAAGRDDADPPRLGTRHEGEQLQRRGREQDPDRRRAERRSELVAAVGEHVDQHGGHREPTRDRDQRAPRCASGSTAWLLTTLLVECRRCPWAPRCLQTTPEIPRRGTVLGVTAGSSAIRHRSAQRPQVA